MRRSWGVAVLAVALLTGTCGTDDNTTPGATTTPGDVTGPQVACAEGTVSGAGATFPQTIVQQWIKDYTARCPGATVNYQGVGSGAGIQQLTAGTVDFGASDAVMRTDEQKAAEARAGPVLHIPWTAGAIAVMYTLPQVRDLRLSPETLASVFAGRITRWDDPRLRADNPGAKLPPTGIQVFHRADASGTTSVFTSYLAAAAPGVWTAGAGKDVRWPVGQGAKGSDGVTRGVKQAHGAIGYAELSFGAASRVGIARIRNGAGEFVAPSASGVAATLASSQVPDDLKVRVDYSTAITGAYPISTPTWALVPAHPADPAKGRLLKSFLTYALTSGQAAAERLFYAPLPSSLADRARAAVESIQT